MSRKVAYACVICLLCLAVISIAAGRFNRANAQGDAEWWYSSADAPEGTPSEQYLPDDDPAAQPQSFEPASPEALISWRVTGSTLKPRDNNVTYVTNGNGSCTYVTAGSAFTVWNIPVQLPQGAVVDTLRMYFYDASNSNTIGWFTIYDLYGAIVQEWNVSSTGNFGNSFTDSAQINHTVDYSVYSYVVNWRPIEAGSNLQLCGFRIFYEPPYFGAEYLPLIRNGNP